jgi:hypothetical protein
MMQLNLSDNSENNLARAFGRLIDFAKSAVSVLGCVLIGSVIIYVLFLFGRIVWAFLEMLLKAFGQF